MRLIKKFVQYFKNRSLVTKLRLFYSLLIIVVLLFSSVFFYLYYRHTLETRTIEYATEILQQSRYNIENNFQQIEQLSMILISSDSVQEYLLSQENLTNERFTLAKSAEKQCIDVMVSRSDIESISLYSNNGEVVGTGQSYTQQEYQQILLAAEPLRGKLCWLFLTCDSPNISAARIVYSTKTMQPVGLLVIRYRVSSVCQIIANQRSHAGQFYLLDSEGRIIAASDRTLTGSPAPFTLLESSSFGNSKQVIDGESYLVNQLLSDYNGWNYLNLLPESELAVGTPSLISFISLTLLCSSLLGMCFSGFIATSVTRPVQKLVSYLRTQDVKQLPMVTYQDQDEFSFLFEAYNDLVQRIEELIKINYEQKLLHSEMEVKILHMQINPHFLYNTLDTMYYMTLDANNRSLAQIIKALAEMLRYSISGDRSFTATVENEIRHAENYCSIQKIRLGEKFQYYFDIADELMNQHLPRLSLQPFVENCIMHGYRGDPNQVLSVEVVGFRVGDHCVFEIRDDGVGLTEEAARELTRRLGSTDFSDVHGIAIPNIHAQLERLFDGQGKISFQSHNAYGGATFTITVPFKQSTEDF